MASVSRKRSAALTPDAGATAPEESTEPKAEGRKTRRKHYVLDNQIGFLLRKANQRHVNVFTAHMAENLTPQQFAVMAKLHEVGPSSQNSLGRQTAMDNSTINGVVARLIDRGLLDKVSSPDDRRMHLIDLTSEGQRTVARVLPMAAEISRMTLAPLSRSEQTTLLRLLKQIT